MIPGVVAAHTAWVSAESYPEIRTILEATSVAATHSTTITAAGNSQVGDRLIVLLAVNNNAVVTPPAGWTMLSSGGISSSIGLAAYFLDKTVDAVSANFGISGGAAVASISLAIKAGTFSVAPVVSAQSSGFSVTTIDPPLATDAGGVACQLVIAFGAHRAGTSSSLSVSSYPLAVNNRLVSTSAVSAMICSAESKADTYNPGAFTLSTAANNRGITVMVRR